MHKLPPGIRANTKDAALQSGDRRVTMSKDQENHDVFSDDDKATVDTTSTKDEVVDDAEQEAQADGEAQQGAEESEKQGEGDAEPPAADGDNKVPSQDKMIPEHRFKAALKDVNDKLFQAQQELATLKAQPSIDPAKDPDGFAREYRIESSRDLARETYSDYDEKIAHFQMMAKETPHLNEVVGNHKNPAKMAYELAKKDLEITELSNLKQTEEWKAFQEFKKNGGKVSTTSEQLSAKKGDAASKVPNLNRTATNVTRGKGSSSEDDDLFSDHHSARS